MNIDEIQLVMDTLSSLGESGKTAFFWWLIADKVLPVVGWLLAFGVFVGAGIRVARMIGEDERRFDRNDVALRSIRDLLNIGSPGHVSEYELGEILQRVTQLAKDDEGKGGYGYEIR